MSCKKSTRKLFNDWGMKAIVEAVDLTCSNRLVTQLIKHMKTSLREGVDFREHLPPLMWLVRDFSLQLKEVGLVVLPILNQADCL